MGLLEIVRPSNCSVNQFYLLLCEGKRRILPMGKAMVSHLNSQWYKNTISFPCSQHSSKNSLPKHLRRVIQIRFLHHHCININLILYINFSQKQPLAIHSFIKSSMRFTTFISFTTNYNGTFILVVIRSFFYTQFP